MIIYYIVLVQVPHFLFPSPCSYYIETFRYKFYSRSVSCFVFFSISAFPVRLCQSTWINFHYTIFIIFRPSFDCRDFPTNIKQAWCWPALTSLTPGFIWLCWILCITQRLIQCRSSSWGGCSTTLELRTQPLNNSWISGRFPIIKLLNYGSDFYGWESFNPFVYR